MSDDLPGAASLFLRHALRALGRGELLQVRADISSALRLLEAAAHTPVNPCPQCGATDTYLAGADFMCTTCGQTWNPFLEPVDKGLVANDARPGGITPDQRRSIDAAFHMLGIGDRPAQLIYASTAAGYPLVNLSELSYDQAADLAEKLVKAAAARAARDEQETGR